MHALGEARVGGVRGALRLALERIRHHAGNLSRRGGADGMGDVGRAALAGERRLDRRGVVAQVGELLREREARVAQALVLLGARLGCGAALGERAVARLDLLGGDGARDAQRLLQEAEAGLRRQSSPSAGSAPGAWAAGPRVIHPLALRPSVSK